MTEIPASVLGWQRHCSVFMIFSQILLFVFSRVSKEFGGSKRCEDVNQLSRFLLSFWVGWEQQDELSNNGRIKHSLSFWLCLLWESHIKTFQNVSHHDEYYRAAPAPVIITLQFSGPQRCFKYYESDDRGGAKYSKIHKQVSTFLFSSIKYIFDDVFSLYFVLVFIFPLLRNPIKILSL